MKPPKQIPEIRNALTALSVLEQACVAESPKHLAVISRVMDILERMERDLIEDYDAQRVRK